MRAFHLLLVALPLAAAACGSDDPGDAAAVFPDTGLLGRHQQVLVSGDATSWDASTTVNFGDGVTVDGVELVGPSTLIVDLTIAPDAGEGAHDVTVTDGGDTFTLAGAYNLVNPITVDDTTPIPQGGLATFTITSHDPETPFNVATDPNTGAFTGLNVTGGAGTTVFINDASAYEINVTVLVDVDGESGDLTVTSTDGGTTVTSPGGTLAVEPRTATVLTEGTASTDTLSTTSLFEITASEAELLTLDVTTANTDADPFFVLLPSSGKWADSLGGHSTDAEVVAAGDKFYLVVLDNAGVDGYSFDLTPSVVSLNGVTPVTEAEPNDDSGTSQALSGAVSMFNGTITDENDVDFVAVTLTQDQTIRIVATSGSGSTDPEVEVIDTDGTTSLDDVDVDLGEDFTFTAPAAGTYFIKVEPSLFALVLLGYQPANDPYQLLVIE